MASSDEASHSAQALQSARTHEPILGARVGLVTGVDEVGMPLVDFSGNPAGRPLPARTTLALGEAEWLAAASSRQEAVLIFEEGDPLRPLIMGLVQQPKAAPRTEALLATVVVPDGERGAATGAPLQVREVDGHLFIRAAREITLECGKARITLRRDGTVLVRGARVESRASGPNLIRGGKVELN